MQANCNRTENMQKKAEILRISISIVDLHMDRCVKLLIWCPQDEKEQLLQYRSTVARLVGRAKSIVQLTPRNPDSPLRSSLPVKAVCDYRQIEVAPHSPLTFVPSPSNPPLTISPPRLCQITIAKDDECMLASNAHRAKWKVIDAAGNEAMVPSVCFTVPPPNQDAVDTAARWDAGMHARGLDSLGNS